MKNLTPILGILLTASLFTNLFLLFQSKITPLFTKYQTTTHTAIKIIDGDTFDTKKGMRIRLAGIDAPEYPKHCYSLQSKNRLQELILGKEVGVEEVTKDSFGRTVAFVFDGDLLINKGMITEGYAKFSDDNNTKYSQELDLAQSEAQKAKRGLWSETCKARLNPDCLIKGNYRKDHDTKLYHTPDCYNYDKISINLDEKDQWFCTEEEAKKAGFIKSSDCP